MIRRIDQQLRVNRLMLAQVDLDQVENKRLRRYLLNYLEIITTISTVLLCLLLASLDTMMAGRPGRCSLPVLYPLSTYQMLPRTKSIAMYLLTG